MRELNEQLRAANEECAHQPRTPGRPVRGAASRHMTGWKYARSNMSELNEQLRAANAECKEPRRGAGRGQQQAARGLPAAGSTQREHARAERATAGRQRGVPAPSGMSWRGLNAQLAQANAKLRELDDARAQFTLLVTHELRGAGGGHPELPEADPRRLRAGGQGARDAGEGRTAGDGATGPDRRPAGARAHPVGRCTRAGAAAFRWSSRCWSSST